MFGAHLLFPSVWHRERIPLKGLICLQGKDPSRDSQMAIVTKVQRGFSSSWWQALFLTANRGGARARQIRLTLFLKGILINIIFEGVIFKFSSLFLNRHTFLLGSKDPEHFIECRKIKYSCITLRQLYVKPALWKFNLNSFNETRPITNSCGILLTSPSQWAL